GPAAGSIVPMPPPGTFSRPAVSDAPAPGAGAPPGDRPGDGAGDSAADHQPAGAGGGGPGCDVAGAGILPGASGAVADHLLPGVELRGAGDDVRAVDRLGVRVEDPL